MVEDAVGAKKLLLLLTLLVFCGCRGASSHITVSAEGSQPLTTPTVNPAAEIPTTPSTKSSPATNSTEEPSPSAGNTGSGQTAEGAEDPPEPALESDDVKSENSALAPISTLIKNASWIMLHEGKKLGTACNAFVRRVLEYSGFYSADFLANDFDLYAKKYIRSYKAVDFKNDVAGGAEIARLKSHLWSYPERTPFIMQWSRSGIHGHIAIVERIKDQLIIYQANLNKYTARKGITTVQSLLSGFNRRVLTVYTDLKR